MYMRKIKPGGSSAIKRWQTNRRYVCLHIDLWFFFQTYSRTWSNRRPFRHLLYTNGEGNKKKLLQRFWCAIYTVQLGREKNYKLFVIFWNFAQLTLVDDVGASPRHKFQAARLRKKRPRPEYFSEDD